MLMTEETNRKFDFIYLGTGYRSLAFADKAKENLGHIDY